MNYILINNNKNNNLGILLGSGLLIVCLVKDEQGGRTDGQTAQWLDADNANKHENN